MRKKPTIKSWDLNEVGKDGWRHKKKGPIEMDIGPTGIPIYVKIVDGMFEEIIYEGYDFEEAGQVAYKASRRLKK